MYKYYFNIGKWIVLVKSSFHCPEEMIPSYEEKDGHDLILEVIYPSESNNPFFSGANKFAIERGLINVMTCYNDGIPYIRAWFKYDWWYKTSFGLEMLLYRAFYTLSTKEQYPNFLIHASAIARKNKGYLFVGPSGSGKTTVAARSIGEGMILHDELVVVCKNGSHIYLKGSPFHSSLPVDIHSTVPLKKVFLLEHGKDLTIKSVSSRLALIYLLKQIAPPISFNLSELQMSDRQLDSTLNFCKTLIDTTSVYLLKFSLEDQIWSGILNL